MKSIAVKLLVLVMLIGVGSSLNATTKEYKGSKTKYIELKNEVIPTSSFFQHSFNDTSGYSYIDGNDAIITTASIYFKLPSGAVASSSVLTLGTPRVIVGYDIIDVRIINSSANATVTLNGSIRVY